ncbi:MAG: hypothetical protein JNK85_11500 [Verrucomicrobiales bacterium]|nr:hypothetical protein [Verrucomicrobiales bacterium]
MNLATPTPKRGLTWLRVFLLIFGIVVVISSVVLARRGRAATGELMLRNETDIPVSVRYRGHFETRTFSLAPGATSTLAFQAADTIALEATFRGLVLKNQVPVFGDSLFAQSPGRVLGEIMVMRVTERTQYNLSTPGWEVEPPGVLGTNIALHLTPFLP